MKLLGGVIAALAAAQAAPAQAPVKWNKAAIDKQCKVGATEPLPPEGQWSGGLRADVANLTPYAVPGAKHVVRSEADCLMIAYGWKLRFITPMDGWDLIPYTMKVPLGGNGPGEEFPQVAARLKEITGGDLDYPLVSYCHNPRCYLSYNLVLRAAKLGYRNVYWLRDGIEAYSSMKIHGDYKAADESAHRNKYRSELWFCRSFYRGAFGKDGEPFAKLLETAFGYPNKNLDEVAAGNDKEVTTELAKARASDAGARKAGREAYAEEEYKVEWLDICHGMMRGLGAVS